MFIGRDSKASVFGGGWGLRFFTPVPWAMQEGQQWCTCLPRAVSGGLMWKATELPGDTSLGLYLFIATATRLVGTDGYSRYVKCVCSITAPGQDGREPSVP